jgi:hypothetical protein
VIFLAAVARDVSMGRGHRSSIGEIAMRAGRRQVIASGLALAAWPRLARAADDGLDPATMRADIALLGRAYNELHPGLLRYQSQGEFDARLVAFDAACARPMSLGAFYLLLSQFLATVRCGHSYANFYNQSEAVQAALFAKRDRIPFAFRWIGGDMVVTADPSATGITPGSVIEAVDGRPASTVLAALLPLVRGDGHNDAKRRALLSVQLNADWETFDIFHSLMFGPGAQFQLRVRDPQGRRRVTAVAAIGLADRRAQRPPHARTNGSEPLWTMTKNGHTAMLTMASWSVYDSKWDWRAWLETRLDEIATDGTTGLVIDLRANEGGLDCGDPIVARLIDRPVASVAAHRLVRYHVVPDALRPALRTYDTSFYDWGNRATRHDARFFDLADEGSASVGIVSGGKRFRGKVVVLIGPANSSATFNFARLIQREQLGVLLGEPTGGNRRGINGGSFFFVHLPGSNLEADLPLVGTFPDGVEPDAGLLPDVEVALTRQAIATGRDEAIVRAMAMVA